MASAEQLETGSESGSGGVRSTSPCSTCSVIVVGAGFGGLAAARFLHNSNVKVMVLESRDRIGGRVYTDYSFGFPVDMGASWLHGVCKDNPLAPVIGKLGLPLYRTCGDNSVLYDHDLESYALFDMDGNQVPQALVTEVGEVFESLLEETKKLREEHPDDMSVMKAFTLVLERRPDLRQEGMAFKVLQWYICRMEGWFAADADSISVQSWDEEELLQGGHGLMVKGYKPVLSSLAEGLDIRLNHRITKISRGLHGVRMSTDDGKVFDADACVVALPLGVLQANVVRFEPKLPEWKEAAISDLGVGNENKIALFFEEVCWPNVEFLGVVASTSYGCSYFLNLHKATGHPVLVYMPAGRLANDIEQLSNVAAANFAIRQLKRILPNAAEPINYLVSRWGTDPNSLGCYSYDAVGKPHDLYERLRAPVDSLFWAGEATSERFPGTVHGAFHTGVMAGSECLKRFAERCRDLEMFQPVMAKEDELTTPLLISRM
ncbi:polyamine oxidase 2-like isoform X2 [Physcomitrium patens]|uniref:Amine oxidase domain-containing protein n=1 Tax=Physcomitrium patens TaxID=3218 RepID=A0A2K1JDN5_PHYPA|nr:probable polyamine oxidase 2 [Physcomitrium patens]XP_024397671.1 probable polyamine oxidase 2 [Physcomitrium patens]XP_024397672.1 probable polyamine oxidase 2 [Physcomitrium patens]XP_024397673.1 probable polyamine oxidase 2 [Physcomitrium patens]PNR39637.1 hypothetical protein PHYPA_019916 [Physcomitrium patens]|eukprot:XP_024397670.1 probable polyamine oxidase 2 [Physcomitrella patens]